MMLHTKTLPAGWLGFDLNVLRRLKFGSVAMPFSADPLLGTYLKRHGARVATNDVLRSAWTRSVAAIQNNNERLRDDDLNTVLEDIYIPGHRLRNPALRAWFSETDSWWFDNARRNIDRLESPFSFAIASSLVMAVGDYARSFNDDNGDLRQPLSNAFRRFWNSLASPVNNGQTNTCQNQRIKEFIAETRTDLLFLRLPPARTGTRTGYADDLMWKEEWLREGNDFWPEIDALRAGSLGMPVETKSQYLQLLASFLGSAGHIRKWAIAHVETGFVTAQDLVDTLNPIRKVEAVYTKDFSELTGTKAVIITA